MSKERPADIDAAIALMAMAARHIRGRSSGTLGKRIYNELREMAAELMQAVDKHHPDFDHLGKPTKDEERRERDRETLQKWLAAGGLKGKDPL